MKEVSERLQTIPGVKKRPLNVLLQRSLWISLLFPLIFTSPHGQAWLCGTRRQVYVLGIMRVQGNGIVVEVDQGIDGLRRGTEAAWAAAKEKGSILKPDTSV